jgi:pimeloyl-ACP methyl ester carboxylesterase
MAARLPARPRRLGRGRLGQRLLHPDELTDADLGSWVHGGPAEHHRCHIPRGLDGLHLAGTVVVPPGVLAGAAVLVHGGGVTREEGGFFTRLALGMAIAGVASLRLDFRAHGASEGRQEDVTLAGIVNDIRAAVGQLQLALGDDAPVSLIGASLGGGIGRTRDSSLGERRPDPLSDSRRARAVQSARPK